jgi:hypothetical protein
MDAKLKHLEFIQNVITRMNTNSFLIKRWVVILVSALFALAANNWNQRYIYITWFVILVFWILDGFYLSQERQYRRLYDHVAQLTPHEINFNMNAKPYRVWRTSWLASIFSKTLVLFYLTFFIITCIITFIMSR